LDCSLVNSTQTYVHGVCEVGGPLVLARRGVPVSTSTAVLWADLFCQNKALFPFFCFPFSLSLCLSLSVWVSSCVCFFLFVYSSVFVSLCLYIFVSLCLSVSLSLCLYVSLSLCISIVSTLAIETQLLMVLAYNVFHRIIFTNFMKCPVIIHKRITWRHTYQVLTCLFAESNIMKLLTQLGLYPKNALFFKGSFAKEDLAIQGAY